MKLKRLTLILAVALGCQGAFAQTSASDANVEFRPHLYGQIQGGAAYTVGETVWKDLISPAGAVSLGYQFAPAFGVRFGVSGWQGKGAAVAPTEVYKFSFLQGNVDLTLNLANLFGYDHARFFNPYVFIGGGAAMGLNNGANQVKSHTPSQYFAYLWADKKLVTPVGRAGIGVELRLTDALAFTLEANGNVYNDHLNSKKADNPDYQYNALLGLKFSFGKPYRTNAKALADADAAAAALKAQREAERQRQEPPQPAPEKKVVEEKPAVDPDADRYEQLNTFFELDSDVITDEEAAKLVDFIQWLNKYNHAVNICGYADVQTGNPKYNLGLSSRRVEKVKKFMLDHGVDASRIISDFKGDTVQPFAENDLNRVVMSIVRK